MKDCWSKGEHPKVWAMEGIRSWKEVAWEVEDSLCS